MKVWPDVAELNKDQIKKVVELEKQLDAVLVAFKRPTTFANLSSEDLKKVQKLEMELGLTLLAMK